jgi:hypothetical protein
MKTGKITLTEETKLNGDVVYFVYDKDGKCMGARSVFKEAEMLFETCVKNVKNNYPIERILSQYP